MFSYISPEARVPPNHPLRKIRALVRDVLGELNHSLGKLYASEGRPSIPPEQLLSALLLQVFYGILLIGSGSRRRSASQAIDRTGLGGVTLGRLITSRQGLILGGDLAS
jgi:hypothetical protein